MDDARGDLDLTPYQHEATIPPPKQGRGCFFYGCIIALVLAFLMMVAIALSGYFGYRAYLALVQGNTSTAPMVLPKVEMPEEARKDLHTRIDAFKAALDKGEETEPLVLNADELNVLLSEASQTKGRVYVIVDGSNLTGEVSVPLDEVGLPGLKGRYFNGKATFHASFRDGVFILTAQSAEVNGRPLPDQFMASLRTKNLAEDIARDPKNAALLGKLDSIQVKDGKVTIRAKPKADRQPDAPKPDKPADEPAKTDPPKPKDGTGKTEPPEPEKGG